MKNRSMIYIVLHFLLLQTSTSTYSMDKETTDKPMIYNFDDIIRSGHDAQDRGDLKTAEEFYRKAYKYKKVQDAQNYSGFVAAVITKDVQRERTISKELDHIKQERKLSEELDERKSKWILCNIM